MYLTYSQLIQLRQMIVSGQGKKRDNSITAIEHSFDSYEKSVNVTRGNRSSANLSKISRRDLSQSIIKRDYSRDSSQDRVNLRNLRKFDKSTGGFRDKDFTEEFSCEKSRNFVNQNKRSKTRPLSEKSVHLDEHAELVPFQDLLQVFYSKPLSPLASQFWHDLVQNLNISDRQQ